MACQLQPSYMRLFVLVGLQLLALEAPSNAEPYVLRRGDPGSFAYRARNKSHKVEIPDLQLVPTIPPDIILSSTSDLGPTTIPPGQSHIFSADIICGPKTPEGRYTVSFQFKSRPDFIMESDPARESGPQEVICDYTPPRLELRIDGSPVPDGQTEFRILPSTSLDFIGLDDIGITPRYGHGFIKLEWSSLSGRRGFILPDGLDVGLPARIGPENYSEEPGDFGPFRPGLHRLTGAAVDWAGNRSTYSWTFHVEIPKDSIPPETGISTDGQQFETSGKFFISGRTKIQFEATDLWEETGRGSGVVETIFALDGPLERDGRTVGAPYHLPFPLSEGMHILRFRSKDYAGNVEADQEQTILVDATPPIPSARCEGDCSPAVGNEMRLGPRGRLVLSQTDPTVSGVASGPARIVLLIDRSPGECGFSLEYPPESEPGQPSGTCANPYYSGPVTLPRGRHNFSFASVDQVGNIGQLQSMPVLVGAESPVGPKE